MKHAASLVLHGLVLGLGVGVGALFTPACSSDEPATAAAPADAGPDVATLPPPSNPCADSADAVYGDPGPLSADPSRRGEIIKCAKDAPLTKEALEARLTELGYAGKSLTSGAQVYRVSYRTERGDAASTPSVSSAIVYVPDVPRAAKLPIVVAARASRGQAPQCAVSKFDPSQAGINADAHRMVYPLVGQGYAVILSDLAGYANFGAPGNPPSAYAEPNDIARSTLDSGRALKKLLPALDDKVVLVGHSQGGHSALASLALAESYGSAAPIAGVAVYAPLWVNSRVAAAVLLRTLGKDFPVATSAVPAVSIYFHYTHAELLDGPGEGKKLFLPAIADKIEAFVKDTCWTEKEATLSPLGSYADEFYDPAFVASVAKPALGVLGGCDPNDAVCTKWLARYSAARPPLTGAAATTPIFFAYGGKDTTIPPMFARCAIDRLVAESKALTVCVDPEGDHGSIVTAQADRVGDWIASVAMGAPAPGACPQNEAAVTDECFTPPPND